MNDIDFQILHLRYQKHPANDKRIIEQIFFPEELSQIQFQTTFIISYPCVIRDLQQNFVKNTVGDQFYRIFILRYSKNLITFKLIRTLFEITEKHSYENVFAIG